MIVRYRNDGRCSRTSAHVVARHEAEVTAREAAVRFDDDAIRR
jgi:hypothetical protein